MIKKNSIIRGLFQIIFVLTPPGRFGNKLRGLLYKPFILESGRNFQMGIGSYIHSPNKLKVGDNVYIGFNSYLGEGPIILEDEVLVGTFVSITASNHLNKNNSFRFGEYTEKEVIIGRGTWIGAHSCILAGITIGRNCLVSAGSVITKDVPDNTIVGGVPAKKIKEVGEDK